MCSSKSCCCSSGGGGSGVGVVGVVIAGLVGLAIAGDAISKDHAAASSTPAVKAAPKVVTRVVVVHEGIPWTTAVLWALAAAAIVVTATFGVRALIRRRRGNRTVAALPPVPQKALDAPQQRWALPSSATDPTIEELTTPRARR